MTSTFIAGIVLGVAFLCIGWTLGRHRGHNDQRSLKCAGCGIYEQCDAARKDIIAIEEMLATEKRRSAAFKGEVNRLEAKLYYQNFVGVAR